MEKYMKKSTYFILTLIALTVLFSSCTTVCPANMGQTVFYDEAPKSVVKKVSGYESVTILGYNSSLGLDTESMDSYLGGKKLNISETNDTLLSGALDSATITVDDGTIPFPVGNRINSYDKDLLAALEESSFTLVNKEALLSTEAYQKISEVNRDEKFKKAGLVSYDVADGYHATYTRNVDGSENIINNFKKSLLESGADFGVIVVERPYLRLHNNHGLVEEYMTKCTPYYTVATKKTFYLIKPSLGNQDFFKQTIIAESGNRHYVENAEENPFIRKSIYTPEMLVEDQKTWMSEMDDASTLANSEFVKWLSSLKNEG